MLLLKKKKVRASKKSKACSVSPCHNVIMRCNKIHSKTKAKRIPRKKNPKRITRVPKRKLFQ